MLRISATNNHRGFTLLELMVVLLIVGLMTGVVSLSLRSPATDPAKQTADQLQRQLLKAQQIAVFKHRDIGLWLQQGGYSFWQWHNQRWQPLQAKGLTTQQWPEALAPHLMIEQQLIDLAASDSPQILLFTDGQILPFSLILKADTATSTLSAGYNLRPEIHLSKQGES